MTNMRSLTFAGLALIASAGAAFAAPRSYEPRADQFYSYYQGQDQANTAYRGSSMYGDQGRNDASCYHGVYPWVIQGCGIK